MIIDNFLRFSNAQAITADAESTNVIDFKQTAPDIGTGENLYCVVMNTTALADTTDSDAQVVVNLVSDAAANLGSSPYEESITVGTWAMATSALAAGTVNIVRLPPGFPVGRYVGIQYDVTTTGSITAGNFTAFLTKDIQKWVAKPNATNASIDIT